MVGPSEASTQKGDLKHGELIKHLIERVHEVEIDVAVVFVLGASDEVKIPKNEPRPQDER
jgi:hypothetical protein